MYFGCVVTPGDLHLNSNSLSSAMYELSQSRALLCVHSFYFFMYVSMVVFVGTFVQRCLEAFL